MCFWAHLVTIKQRLSATTETQSLRGKPLKPHGKDSNMRNRNIHIQCWLDKKEAEHLQKMVKRSGLTREAYLRQLINGLVPRDLPPPDYFAMMRALYAVGDTLGKIAQKSHALGEIDAAHYDEAVQLFRQTVRDITATVILPEKRKR